MISWKKDESLKWGMGGEVGQGGAWGAAGCKVEVVPGEERWGVLVQSCVVGERQTTPAGQVLHFEGGEVKGAQAGLLPQVIPAGREALTKTASAQKRGDRNFSSCLQFPTREKDRV